MTLPTTRERILEAAWTAFEAGGLAGLSLRKVAGEVGLTPMAIYRHFADKEALVEALVIDGLDRWRDRLAGIQTADPALWLHQLTEEFLDYALEEPRRFEAAFLLPSRTARQFPDDFARGASPPGQLWLARLETLRNQGRLAPGADPLEAGMTVWALGQGLISLYRAGRFTGGAEAFRELYRRALRRCLLSFLAEPGDLR